MAYCIYFFCALPLPLKNTLMYAETLFPHIVEEYKLYLRTNLDAPMPLSKFARPYRVRYKSLSQWMLRHGLSVTLLRHEAFLEECGMSREEAISKLAARQTAPAPCVVLKGTGKLPDDKLLSRVNISFPDGLQVSINAASPAALSDFIDRYNHLLDAQDVRIG